MNKIAKAIAAAIVSAFALYQTAQGVESAGGGAVTLDEWYNIGIYALFVGATTYLVPNEKKDAN